MPNTSFQADTSQQNSEALYNWLQIALLNSFDALWSSSVFFLSLKDSRYCTIFRLGQNLLQVSAIGLHPQNTDCLDMETPENGWGTNGMARFLGVALRILLEFNFWLYCSQTYRGMFKDNTWRGALVPRTSQNQVNWATASRERIISNCLERELKKMRNHCVINSGQCLHLLRLLGIHGCLAISHVTSQE